MALNIEDLRKQRRGAMYTSPQRLCATADGELCECDDPEAVKLVVGEGCEIPNAEAAKYGLIAGAEAETAERAEAEGLEASTVAELRELADERGVELPAQATKAHIIALLEEAEAAGEGDAESGDGEE